jgi:hypothetical protein
MDERSDVREAHRYGITIATSKTPQRAGGSALREKTVELRHRFCCQLNQTATVYPLPVDCKDDDGSALVVYPICHIVVETSS